MLPWAPMAADGGTMLIERQFTHDVRSIREARFFVAEHLESVDPETRERVVLLVSELASNAVRHASSDFSVTLEQTGLRVRVEVSDGGPGEPVLQKPDVTRVSGRGLQLVQDLSHEWGIRVVAAGTKAVWFTVSPAG